MPFAHGVIVTSLFGAVLGIALRMPGQGVTTFLIGQLLTLGVPVLIAVQAQGKARQAKAAEAPRTV